MRDSNKMHGNCIISIIVPVYNVSKYLRRCLFSIQAQTFTQFEAILIDDCSTDNSGEICDEFAKIDSRFRVIHKPVNEKLSAARNTGLKVARGKYIAYLDSDDYIHPQMYETLYKMIQKNDYSMAICNFIKTKEENLQFKPIGENLSYWEMSADKFVIGPYWQSYYCVVWNKLYKRDLIYGIEFIKDVYAEDQFYNVHVFIRKPRVICCDFYGIAYYQRPDSIVHTDSTFKDIDKLKFPLMNFEDIQSICETDETRFHLLWKMMLLMIRLKNKKTTGPLEILRKDILNSYKTQIQPEFIHSKIYTTSDVIKKVSIYIMMYLPLLYRLLLHLHIKMSRNHNSA